MINRKSWIVVVAALLFSAQVQAGEVTVSDAWARATAPGQENGSVGLVITSQRDARLIAVTSPLAASAEIHTMTMDNGVVMMLVLSGCKGPHLCLNVNFFRAFISEFHY